MTGLSRAFGKAAVIAAMAGALGLALPATAQPATSGDVEASSDAPLTAGERKLAQLLEGRVAGEPVACIPTGRYQKMQTVDGIAYVYGRGDTIYLQRTSNPGQIDSDDTVSVRRLNAFKVCKLDRATTFAPFSGVVTGVVFYEDFVPYTRVKTARSGDS